MADNVTEFKLDLARFAKKVGTDLGTVRRKIVLDLLTKTTEKTPVDRGTLRASWAVSDGQPSTYKAPEGSSARHGPITATFEKPFEITYLTNNMPYAQRIEFAGWSKIKAPMGMVRVSLAEVQAEIGAITDEL